MAHISENKSIKMNCVDVEQINYEMNLEQVKAPEIIKPTQVERKIVKKKLSKLFKKAELNAKYPEQIIPIQRVKQQQQVYRDYGMR